VRTAKQVRDAAMRQTVDRTARAVDSLEAGVKDAAQRVAGEQREVDRTHQEAARVEERGGRVFGDAADYDRVATLAVQRGVAAEASGEEAKNLAEAARGAASRAISTEDAAQKELQDAARTDTEAEQLFQDTLQHFQRSTEQMRGLYSALELNQRRLDVMKKKLREQDVVIGDQAMQEALVGAHAAAAHDALSKIKARLPEVHEREAANAAEMEMTAEWAKRPWKMWWG